MRAVKWSIQTQAEAGCDDLPKAGLTWPSAIGIGCRVFVSLVPPAGAAPPSCLHSTRL